MRRWAALVALLVVTVASPRVHAQAPQRVLVRLDNDAFDFWMQPYNRPDEEYTSGVHITYEGARAPWWSRSLMGAGAACTYHVLDCQSSRAEIGQDIYTPSLSADDPHVAAGARANGGWLYLSQSARSLHASRSDEVTVAIGVTGPPSLARFTQEIAHSLEPAFNRPTDWTRQIRFEPGAILGYEQRRRVIAASAGPIGFDLVPSVSVKAGNVETSAAAGFETRLGWNLPHPWLAQSVPFSFVLMGGISGHAVARDIFLDGNTLHPDYRVGHEFFVGSGDVGVEVRVRALSLSYRAVNQTRAYAGGPKWHPWASMVAGVTFDK